MNLPLYDEWTGALWYHTLHMYTKGKTNKKEMDRMLDHLKQGNECCEKQNDLHGLLNHLSVAVKLENIAQDSLTNLPE